MKRATCGFDMFGPSFPSQPQWFWRFCYASAWCLCVFTPLPNVFFSECTSDQESCYQNSGEYLPFIPDRSVAGPVSLLCSVCLQSIGAGRSLRGRSIRADSSGTRPGAPALLQLGSMVIAVAFVRQQWSFGYVLTQRYPKTVLLISALMRVMTRGTSCWSL